MFDVPPQKCINSDNTPLAAGSIVQRRVVDPANVPYSVLVKLTLAIQNLALTQLRPDVGKMRSGRDLFSAREKINSLLLKDLDVATELEITRMYISARNYFEPRNRAGDAATDGCQKRSRRAKIIQSKGERNSAVNAARNLV